jgi:cyclophilin family peptidyl-prolyl cis-trans isomerase
VAQITYTIGERLEEVGFIRIGLYGNDCPSSVKELLLFLSSGLITMSEEQRQDSIGMQSVPVGLLCGGIVPNIYPGTAVEFGVPSQSKAYAASRGMRNAGPDFVPQPRPATQRGERFPRPHDVAGLVSIPEGGIGNGGSGAESDDDAFGSAFLITADAAPLLDSAKTKHRVVGQVIDDASMTNLARLASLPVQKGLKGVLPGQGYGSPLLKVTIQDVGVQRVK